MLKIRRLANGILAFGSRSHRICMHWLCHSLPHHFLITSMLSVLYWSWAYQPLTYSRSTPSSEIDRRRWLHTLVPGYFNCTHRYTWSTAISSTKGENIASLVNYLCWLDCERDVKFYDRYTSSWSVIVDGLTRGVWEHSKAAKTALPHQLQNIESSNFEAPIKNYYSATYWWSSGKRVSEGNHWKRGGGSD
jgi:hypothetical protein